MADLPFVSVITPTYNRRRFLPLAVACYRAQTYPKSRMEWVVIDDGDDDVSDFFAALAAAEPELNVRFIRHATRARIGAKRNELHREARGDILVSWDDDDYYPPDRVAHVVDCFAAAPDVQVAGCSTLYIYFSDVRAIYRLGPFTRRHATNGTMAVRRAFALSHFYDESVSHGEEESFLERFSFPMIQLSPLKVMLVMSHNSNTYNKEALRDNPRALSARTDLQLSHFIKDPAMCAAFAATSEAVAQAFKPMASAPAPASALAGALAGASALAPASAPAPALTNMLSRAGAIRSKIAQKQPIRLCVGPAAASFAPSAVGAIRRRLDAVGPVAVVGPADQPDVYVCQILEAAQGPDCFTVVVSGEAWHQPRRADIVVAPVKTGNADAVVYYPFLYSSLDERRADPTKAPPADLIKAPRDAFCAFMYSAPCEHRNKIFQEMRAALSRNTVDALGVQCSDDPAAAAAASSRNAYSAAETYNDIAVAKYRRYRYVLAIENAWVDGYFTEKLINPIIAGAVPLYWGHPSAFDFVNKARVVYIPDFPSTAALAAWLESRTEADWAKIAAEPWYAGRGEPASVQLRLEVDIGKALATFGVQKNSKAPTETPAETPLAIPPRQMLEGLPPVYYINLDRRPDRRAHMEAMFAEYGVRATRVVATDGEAAAKIIAALPPTLRWGEVACTVSHLRAIQEWVSSSGAAGEKEPYALICEDDLSFETVPAWRCDWKTVAAALPLHWDVLQLAVIFGPGAANMGIHYRAPNDFSTCAYLIRRPYAERLVATHWDAANRRWHFPDTPGVRQAAEEVLYRPARCLTAALFTYLDGAPGPAGAVAASDIQTAAHVEALHVRSRAAVLEAWPRMTALQLLRM